MKCRNCGKDVELPHNAYRNLEVYKVGGSVIVASKCCDIGYVLKMKISYSISEYTGNSKEDDWGVKLR